jgi:hypothetical protein
MPIDPRTIKEGEHASARARIARHVVAARVRITTLDVTQCNTLAIDPIVLPSREHLGRERREGGL